MECEERSVKCEVWSFKCDTWNSEALSHKARTRARTGLASVRCAQVS